MILYNSDMKIPISNTLYKSENNISDDDEVGFRAYASGLGQYKKILGRLINLKTNETLMSFVSNNNIGTTSNLYLYCVFFA